MRRPTRRWVEPALVAAISLALVAAFWAAWERTGGPSSGGRHVVDARGLRIPDQAATAGPSTPTPAPAPAASTSASPYGLLARLKHRAAVISKERQAAEQRSADLARPPVSTFTFAQFNTLGASHTTPGGEEPQRAAGGVRGAWVGELFLAHRVDVAAVQEFQRPQAGAFARAVGDTYAVWPGLSSTPEDGENSVVWRRDRFEALQEHSVSHPYFDGRPRNYPVVLLRDLQTGTRFWVTSYHNPADTARFGRQAAWRQRSLALEIPEVTTLMARTEQPVIVAGDMNDREAFFCPFARATGMHSASGGSSTAAGCSLPVRWIDWIMGSPAVSFSAYAQDRGALVGRTSDHPLVLSEVTVTGDLADRRTR